MTTTNKPRALLYLHVPTFGSTTDEVQITAQPIEATWERNNHLQADVLRVSIGWREGGVDPRAIAYAHGSFFLWDANKEDFDEKKHLRFQGICIKADRKLHESGWVVELMFNDYTACFIHHKPLASTAMPKYADTLQTIWDRICDNTGPRDPANDKKILSTVQALKGDHLRFLADGVAEKTLGSLVSDRFRKVANPTPKHNASSWDVWQWCVGALGLISYIDKDECIVTNTTEHYKSENAARGIFGENIHTFEENVDLALSSKGILLKSFDPVSGTLLEAFYPPPGDERLKIRRGALGKKSEGGAAVTANEVSGDYDEFTNWNIQDQASLDRAAKEAYEERSRQQVEGSFKTSVMELTTRDGSTVDILDLRAGDALAIEMDSQVYDSLARIGGKQEQIRHLVDIWNYDENLAEIIIRNIGVEELSRPTYHIKSLEVKLTPDSFEVDAKWHNLILVS